MSRTRRPAFLVRRVEPLDHAAGEQRAVDRDGLVDVPPLGRTVLVVIGEQVAHRGERVAGAGDDVQHHGVGDLEARGQRLGVGRDEPLERRLPPGHEALRRLLAHHLAPCLRVIAGLGQGLLVLHHVLGGLDHDSAGRVVTGPAGPAGDLVKLRLCRSRVFFPSYLDKAVNRTVRIGTLMPTPRVSVPQMTLSSPAWVSVSTSRRYLGSMPAWCTPMPCRTSRDRVLPKPAEQEVAVHAGDQQPFSARLQTFTLISACACSSAAAWVKCTT